MDPKIKKMGTTRQIKQTVDRSIKKSINQIDDEKIINFFKQINDINDFDIMLTKLKEFSKTLKLQIQPLFKNIIELLTTQNITNFKLMINEFLKSKEGVSSDITATTKFWNNKLKDVISIQKDIEDSDFEEDEGDEEEYQESEGEIDYGDYEDIDDDKKEVIDDIYNEKYKVEYSKIPYIKVSESIENKRKELFVKLNTKYKTLYKKYDLYLNSYINSKFDDNNFIEILKIIPEYILIAYFAIIYQNSDELINTDAILRAILDLDFIKTNNISYVNDDLIKYKIIKYNFVSNINDDQLSIILNINQNEIINKYNEDYKINETINTKRIKLIVNIIDESLIPIRTLIDDYIVEYPNDSFFNTLDKMPDWVIILLTQKVSTTPNIQVGELYNEIIYDQKYQKYLYKKTVMIEEEYPKFQEKKIEEESQKIENYDKKCYNILTSASFVNDKINEIREFYPSTGNKKILTWISGITTTETDDNTYKSYIIDKIFIKDERNVKLYKPNVNFYKLQCNSKNLYKRTQKDNILTCFDDYDNPIYFYVAYTPDILEISETTKYKTIVQDEEIFNLQNNELKPSSQNMSIILKSDINEYIHNFFITELLDSNINLPEDYIKEIETYLIYKSNSNNISYIENISKLLGFIKLFKYSRFVSDFSKRLLQINNICDSTIQQKLPEIFDLDLSEDKNFINQLKSKYKLDDVNILLDKYRQNIIEKINIAIDDYTNILKKNILIVLSSKESTTSKIILQSKFNPTAYGINIYKIPLQVESGIITDIVRNKGYKELKNIMGDNISEDYLKLLENIIYNISFNNVYNYFNSISIIKVFSENELNNTTFFISLKDKKIPISEIMSILMDNSFDNLFLYVPEISSNVTIDIDSYKNKIIEKIKYNIKLYINILTDIYSNSNTLYTDEILKIYKDKDVIKYIKLPKNYKDFSQDIGSTIQPPIFVKYHDKFDGNDYELYYEVISYFDMINPITNREIPDDLFKSEKFTKETEYDTISKVEKDLTLPDDILEDILKTIYVNVSKMEEGLVKQNIDKPNLPNSICSYCENFIVDDSTMVKTVKKIVKQDGTPKYDIIKFCNIKCFENEDEYDIESDTEDIESKSDKSTIPTISAIKKLEELSTTTPISIPKTPISIPNTPVSIPNTPVSTPKTPISTAKTPISIPKTPVSTPKTPISIPKTPISITKTPISVPKTPISIPKTPISIPKTPSKTKSISIPNPQSPPTLKKQPPNISKKTPKTTLLDETTPKTETPSSDWEDYN